MGHYCINKSIFDTILKYQNDSTEDRHPPMAKKSMIEREKKRQRLVTKYAAKRQELKAQLAMAETQEEVMSIHRQLQQLPRNSAPSRLRNRCWLTGRPRGYFRDFGLCRNALRDMAHQGLLPGVVKSSW